MFRVGRASLLISFLVSITPQLVADEPAGIAVLSSGDIAILDAFGRIDRVSGTSKSPIIESFGLFQPADFIATRLRNQDALLVTLRLQQRSNVAFSSLIWLQANGRKVAEYPLSAPGGSLFGVAIDPRTQVAYCSDSQLGKIYRIDLRHPKPAFATWALLRDPGILGPLILDVRRDRVLVGDLRKGRIVAVGLRDANARVVLDSGTIREPLGLALDPATDRLYIADATKERVWVGTFAANGNLSVRPFNTSYKFHEPTAVALAGSFLWVVDRAAEKAIRFSQDGVIRQQIDL